jgi:hypothetical protein
MAQNRKKACRLVKIQKKCSRVRVRVKNVIHGPKWAPKALTVAE